jgi:alpha-2-macroglobulin
MRLRSLLSIFLVPVFPVFDALAGGPDFAALKKEAEASYAEGSYARAHALYDKARRMNLPAADKRWVEFRWGDTLWRSQAGTESSDETLHEKAVEALTALVDAPQREADRDPLRAEAEESLGDCFWMGRYRRWYEAWPRYEKALEYWSGEKDVEKARGRYLSIVKKITSPRQGWSGDGEPLPTAVVENALKIARTDDDKIHFHYLLARSLHNVRDIAAHRRAAQAFETVLKAGKGNEWYDDALYHFAHWTAQQGKAVEEKGSWRFEPDYVKALGFYQRILKEFKQGETAHFDSAASEIKEITKSVLSMGVSNAFLPASPVHYDLRWRNIKKIQLTLFKLDLLETPLPAEKGAADWLHSLSLKGREVAKAWTHDTGDVGDHRPGDARLSADGIPSGAYILEARAGNETVREFVLVTDAALVVKTVRRQVLVYVCDALTGAPLPDSRVRVWERYYRDSSYAWTLHEKTADKDGLAVFELPRESGSGEVLIFGGVGARQAFASAYPGHYSSREDADYWRIYAVTDRPAYRPGDTVQWKCLARRYLKDSYTTPAGAPLYYEVSDPRGAKVKEGTLALNNFGSAWDSLLLTEAMPLGEYQVVFWKKKDGDQVGSATLFRLEEYKLPEFKVAVKTPEDNGRRKIFRLGDEIEVNIQADYYFGGAVADAAVELVVTPRPFRHRWSPYRDCGWYYDGDDLSGERDYGYSPFPVIHETLKTDAGGRASFRLPTSDLYDGVLFNIEARVTDKSRREIIGRQTLKVMSQSYSVYVRPEHNLHRPKTLAKVSFKALDANDQPVEAEGVVKVTMDRWTERGEEKRYEHEDISTQKVRTDAAGDASISFTPQKDGFYRITWTSQDKDGNPIVGETVLWAMTGATREVGYRLGGFELVLDKDTFRVGQTAPVMIVAPDAGRHVLFSVEGEDLYSYKLIHMTGPVKLVEIPVEEKYVPNFFVNASLVKDASLYVDSKQVVVPPLEHFLTVDVAADKEEYRPREKGKFTITARDHEGKPVSAEVSLSLVDESVFYIQEPYAGDPRQFYFGQRRGQSVQTQTSFFEIPYARFSKDKDRRFINELEQESGLEETLSNKEIQGYSRRGESMRMKSMPSPMAAMAPSEGASEDRSAGDAGAGGGPSVLVRNDFRATALWLPDVATGPDGKAVVEAAYPDSLTSWRASVVALTAESRFGQAQAATRTKQPLIIRLQAPRFFLVGDRLTLSAVVNNNTNKDLRVACDIAAGGLVLENGASTTVQVKAGGEARVDWTVSVREPGEAKIRVSARGGDHGDAMEKSYPVFPHGLDKFLAKSGKMRGDQVKVNLDLPARKPESTEFSVQVTPSLAVGMLDALPYLIDYPYGCTEQTMSRFLPAVLVAKTLRDMGLSAADIEGKVFGGIEQEHAAKTHPKGPASLGRLDDMVNRGLDRLYDFQHADGGWGWWKEGSGDNYMTAYVVWGLSLAKSAGLPLKAGVMEKGADFLKNNIVKEETQFDNQAWMLHALTAAGGRGEYVDKAFKNLWAHRDRLNAYTRALLAMSAKDLGHMEEARTLIRNLENGVKRDEAPDTSVIQDKPSASESSVQGTAHWGADRIWWRWSEGGIESTAFALRALLAVDPKNALVEPVTNWLIKNRRGSQWSNTRDTAMALMALNDYLKASGESSAVLEYEVLVNGRSLARRKVTPKEVLSAPSRFRVEPSGLKDGINEILIRRVSGQGPLYFSVQSSFYSLEEPVKEAAHELFVRRDYFHERTRQTLLKGALTDKVLLKDGDTVMSGDRIETVLTLETKNDYEYLLLEDLKPAGLEAVEVRSGESLYARQLKSGAVDRTFKQGETDRERKDLTGRMQWVYQELRDRKVALFIDRLPEGVWEIRYSMRAEVPGKFHALPVSGHAMYVPEIRGNSAEIRLEVSDK